MAQCPVQGNSDLYGLGIRVGIYIQLISVQLSGLTSNLKNAEDHLATGVVVFVLAAGATLLRLILRQEIEAVEVYPIMSLLIVLLFTCRPAWWRARTTMLIFVGESICALALTTWFWWHGMDTLPRSCVDDYAFFFAKVSIWHWFRTFNKVLTVFTVILGGIGVIGYIVAFVAFIWKRNSDDDENHERYNAGFSFEFILNAGIIVYVEMAMRWNNISGVNSLSTASQFMPFFIALAQLLETIYSLANLSFHFAISEESESIGEQSDDEKFECCHKVFRNDNEAVELEDGSK